MMKLMLTMTMMKKTLHRNFEMTKKTQIKIGSWIKKLDLVYFLRDDFFKKNGGNKSLFFSTNLTNKFFLFCT